MRLAEIRKLVVAFIGAAGEILTLGLVHGSAAYWLGTSLAVLSAAGVYAVPNAQPIAQPMKSAGAPTGTTLLERDSHA